jgi:SPP1 family phage portal protein
MYASNRPTTGRLMIMTDEKVITKENIVKVVSKGFADHQHNVRQEMFLFDYERGIQPILDREKDIRPEINATVVENNAAKIVDTHVGYCFSNPITFVQRAKVELGKDQKVKDKETDGDKDDMKIAVLNKMNQEQKKSTKDIQLARNLFICGVGYQMVLPNRKRKAFSPFELMVLNPFTSFVIYSNDAYREQKVAVTYFIHDDGTVSLTAYSEDFIFEIERGVQPDDYTQNPKVTPNVLGMIPIVEFSLNDRMGIFERVIPLMDAINLVNSDRINDILQHVQSLLWLHNCELDKEEKQKLVDGDGVIMTQSSEGREAKISYLTQTLNQTEVQTLVNYLQEQLQQQTSTPSWQEASGGSTTGAMQLSNGWQCLEIYAKTVEQLFADPEMQILEIETAIMKNDKRDFGGLEDIEIADIEIRFCRTKTYDLVSKTNALVSLLNAGVDGLTAFNTVGLFTDSQQAWVDSAKTIKAMQKKLTANEETKVVQQPGQGNDANAYKDDEGNGGANNKEKDKSDESLQPSKVAQVED